MTPSETEQAIAAVWRIESARVIAGLARIVHDVGLAEDLAQDALVAALEQWPTSGIPDNPGAWLMGTAKHRAIDALRHNAMRRRKQDAIEYETPTSIASTEDDLHAAMDDEVGDDLLRLIFTACHPVLKQEGRVALTLRLMGGLTTDEIARAFLVPEPTIAQRIVRAKRTLAAKQVPFEVPRGVDLGERLSSVLAVIYLIFNEGYSATAGEDWMRPALCEEALRLGRILVGLMPLESEVHGLVALMEIQASRTRARVGPKGEPIVLLEQDRGKWDQLLIHRGLAALERAFQLGLAHGGRERRERLTQVGPYALQAAIAACHARAGTAAETDWHQIVEWYDALLTIVPSAIVALNRAVAVGMASGPAAALVIVDEISREPTLKQYHLLPSVRADLLMKLGRAEEARREWLRAAAMTSNEKERTLLRQRGGEA